MQKIWRWLFRATRFWNNLSVNGKAIEKIESRNLGADELLNNFQMLRWKAVENINVVTTPDIFLKLSRILSA